LDDLAPGGSGLAAIAADGPAAYLVSMAGDVTGGRLNRMRLLRCVGAAPAFTSDAEARSTA
jgi:hypothetical protein